MKGESFQKYRPAPEAELFFGFSGTSVILARCHWCTSTTNLRAMCKCAERRKEKKLGRNVYCARPLNVGLGLRKTRQLLATQPQLCQTVCYIRRIGIENKSWKLIGKLFKKYHRKISAKVVSKFSTPQQSNFNCPKQALQHYW